MAVAFFNLPSGSLSLNFSLTFLHAVRRLLLLLRQTNRTGGSEPWPFLPVGNGSVRKGNVAILFSLVIAVLPDNVQGECP